MMYFLKNVIFEFYSMFIGLGDLKKLRIIEKEFGRFLDLWVDE